MFEFELPRYRQAQVWCDEEPPAGYSGKSILSRVVRPTILRATTHRTAAIELRVHHGGVVSYALLGAELRPAAIDGLELVVPVREDGPALQASLALQSDEVQVGLKGEYARAVIDVAARACDGRPAPTGASLTFRWAAHAAVGSSPRAFGIACAIVCRLVTLPEVSSEQVKRVLEDILTFGTQE